MKRIGSRPMYCATTRRADAIIPFNAPAWLRFGEEILLSDRQFIAQRAHAMSTNLDTKHYPVTHTDAEWHKILTPEQFHIMREHGTERAGSCALNYEKRAGTFYCAGCEQALFASKKKFESGTGWPSFNDPVPGSVETTTDRSYGMTRTEVHCSRCGSHLGHVFDDGPPPTHLRYCINGVAMNFKPE
jgi:peptide-methionine (R)-S-oxide reductase